MLGLLNKKIDLTEGPILKKLIIFTIPIFIGNLFQQFYNMSDALIVGNFADNDAFAAVSSTGSITFFLVGFFNGIGMGASVVVSRYVGAKDKDNTRNAIHTVFALGLVMSVIATIVGVAMTPFILKLMKTPASVYPKSLMYLSIYFGGIITVIVYNICMGIMRAYGDSTSPLYYLIISSLLNIILDLLFVGVFKWDVAGAAVATVISQGVSCALCIRRMTHLTDETRLSLKDIKFHNYILKDAIIIGLPTGLQNSIISIGNMVVQTNINSFGPFAMSGQGAYAKIEGFVFLPITCMSMALTTFISQNLGAKAYDRAKKAAFQGTLLSVILAQLIGVIILLNTETFLRIFISEPEAIKYGIIHTRITAWFYVLVAFSHCASGILRGCGKSIVPMLTMLAFWCIIRVLYVTITISYIPKFQVISWAYPITWTLSSIVFIIILLFMDWVHGLEKKI